MMAAHIGAHIFFGGEAVVGDPDLHIGDRKLGRGTGRHFSEGSNWLLFPTD